MAPLVFSATVDADIGGTPMVAIDPVPDDYAGDDATELVQYPEPELDEFGRPVP